MDSNRPTCLPPRVAGVVTGEFSLTIDSIRWSVGSRDRAKYPTGAPFIRTQWWGETDGASIFCPSLHPAQPTTQDTLANTIRYPVRGSRLVPYLTEMRFLPLDLYRLDAALTPKPGENPVDTALSRLAARQRARLAWTNRAIDMSRPSALATGHLDLAPIAHAIETTGELSGFSVQVPLQRDGRVVAVARVSAAYSEVYLAPEEEPLPPPSILRSRAREAPPAHDEDSLEASERKEVQEGDQENARRGRRNVTFADDVSNESSPSSNASSPRSRSPPMAAVHSNASDPNTISRGVNNTSKHPSAPQPDLSALVPLPPPHQYSTAPQPPHILDSHTTQPPAPQSLDVDTGTMTTPRPRFAPPPPAQPPASTTTHQNLPLPLPLPRPFPLPNVPRPVPAAAPTTAHTPALPIPRAMPLSRSRHPDLLVMAVTVSAAHLHSHLLPPLVPTAPATSTVTSTTLTSTSGPGTGTLPGPYPSSFTSLDTLPTSLPSPYCILHNPLLAPLAPVATPSPSSAALLPPQPTLASIEAQSSSLCSSYFSPASASPAASRYIITPAVPHTSKPHWAFTYTLPVVASTHLPLLLQQPLRLELWSAPDTVLERAQRHWREAAPQQGGVVAPSAGYLQLLQQKLGVKVPPSSYRTSSTQSSGEAAVPSLSNTADNPANTLPAAPTLPYAFAAHSRILHDPASLAALSSSPEANERLPSLRSRSTFLGLAQVAAPYARVAELSSLLQATRVARLHPSAASVEPAMQVMDLVHSVCDVRDPLRGVSVGSVLVRVRIGPVELIAAECAHEAQMLALAHAQHRQNTSKPGNTTLSDASDESCEWLRTSALASAQRVGPETVIGCDSALTLPAVSGACLATAAACEVVAGVDYDQVGDENDVNSEVERRRANEGQRDTTGNIVPEKTAVATSSRRYPPSLLSLAQNAKNRALAVFLWPSPRITLPAVEFTLLLSDLHVPLHTGLATDTFFAAAVTWPAFSVTGGPKTLCSGWRNCEGYSPVRETGDWGRSTIQAEGAEMNQNEQGKNKSAALWMHLRFHYKILADDRVLSRGDDSTNPTSSSTSSAAAAVPSGVTVRVRGGVLSLANARALVLAMLCPMVVRVMACRDIRAANDLTRAAVTPISATRAGATRLSPDDKLSASGSFPITSLPTPATMDADAVFGQSTPATIDTPFDDTVWVRGRPYKLDAATGKIVRLQPADASAGGDADTVRAEGDGVSLRRPDISGARMDEDGNVLVPSGIVSALASDAQGISSITTANLRIPSTHPTSTISGTSAASTTSPDFSVPLSSVTTAQAAPGPSSSSGFAPHAAPVLGSLRRAHYIQEVARHVAQSVGQAQGGVASTGLAPDAAQLDARTLSRLERNSVYTFPARDVFHYHTDANMHTSEDGISSVRPSNGEQGRTADNAVAVDPSVACIGDGSGRFAQKHCSVSARLAALAQRSDAVAHASVTFDPTQTTSASNAGRSTKDAAESARDLRAALAEVEADHDVFLARNTTATQQDVASIAAGRVEPSSLAFGRMTDAERRQYEAALPRTVAIGTVETSAVVCALAGLLYRGCALNPLALIPFTDAVFKLDGPTRAEVETKADEASHGGLTPDTCADITTSATRSPTTSSSTSALTSLFHAPAAVWTRLFKYPHNLPSLLHLSYLQKQGCVRTPPSHERNLMRARTRANYSTRFTSDPTPAGAGSGVSVDAYEREWEAAVSSGVEEEGSNVHLVRGQRSEVAWIDCGCRLALLHERVRSVGLGHELVRALRRDDAGDGVNATERDTTAAKDQDANFLRLRVSIGIALVDPASSTTTQRFEDSAATSTVQPVHLPLISASARAASSELAWLQSLLTHLPLAASVTGTTSTIHSPPAPAVPAAAYGSVNAFVCPDVLHEQACLAVAHPSYDGEEPPVIDTHPTTTPISASSDLHPASSRHGAGSVTAPRTAVAADQRIHDTTTAGKPVQALHAPTGLSVPVVHYHYHTHAHQHAPSAATALARSAEAPTETPTDRDGADSNRDRCTGRDSLSPSAAVADGSDALQTPTHRAPAASTRAHTQASSAVVTPSTRQATPTSTRTSSSPPYLRLSPGEISAVASDWSPPPRAQFHYKPTRELVLVGDTALTPPPSPPTADTSPVTDSRREASRTRVEASTRDYDSSAQLPARTPDIPRLPLPLSTHAKSPETHTFASPTSSSSSSFASSFAFSPREAWGSASTLSSLSSLASLASLPSPLDARAMESRASRASHISDTIDVSRASRVPRDSRTCAAETLSSCAPDDSEITDTSRLSENKQRPRDYITDVEAHSAAAASEDVYEDVHAREHSHLYSPTRPHTTTSARTTTSPPNVASDTPVSPTISSASSPLSPRVRALLAKYGYQPDAYDTPHHRKAHHREVLNSYLSSPTSSSSPSSSSSSPASYAHYYPSSARGSALSPSSSTAAYSASYTLSPTDASARVQRLLAKYNSTTFDDNLDSNSVASYRSPAYSARTDAFLASLSPFSPSTRHTDASPRDTEFTSPRESEFTSPASPSTISTSSPSTTSVSPSSSISTSAFSPPSAHAQAISPPISASPTSHVSSTSSTSSISASSAASASAALSGSSRSSSPGSANQPPLPVDIMEPTHIPAEADEVKMEIGQDEIRVERDVVRELQLGAVRDTPPEVVSLPTSSMMMTKESSIYEDNFEHDDNEEYSDFTSTRRSSQQASLHTARDGISEKKAELVKRHPLFTIKRSVSARLTVASSSHGTDVHPEAFATNSRSQLYSNANVDEDASELCNKGHTLPETQQPVKEGMDANHATYEDPHAEGSWDYDVSALEDSISELNAVIAQMEGRM